MAEKPLRGIERVKSNLQTCIDKGDFYEALQMYRTIFYRYKSLKKYKEAYDLLSSGALLLLRNQQLGSGGDLAILTIDLLMLKEFPMTDDIIRVIGEIFSLMDPHSPERAAYTTKAIRWSCDVGSKRGHPALHVSLAMTLWQEGNYAESRYHFIRSNDGTNCGLMLVEYSDVRGFTEEVDLFVTQAVLQLPLHGIADNHRYLCLSNKEAANDCFKSYTTTHNRVQPKAPPYNLPILNFLWMLLLSIEGGALAVYTIICDSYRVSLERDPIYAEYLRKIGTVFFGLPKPVRPKPRGLLGNLMQGLMVDPSENVVTSGTSASSIPVSMDTDDLD